MKTTEELRDDNFLRIYAGQERWFGSKEANDRKRQDLVAKGDDLRISRLITHGAHASQNNPTPKADVMAEIARSGYAKHDGHHEIHTLFFCHNDTLNSMVFDRKTLELNDFLFEHGWIYDGWDCDAERGKEADESAC